MEVGEKNRFLVIIIVFCILLILPNAIMLTDWEKKSEYSKLTLYPEINYNQPSATAASLKAYYLEHYGLKSTFVNSYFNFKKNVLVENPLPERVVEGNDGWFFLGNHFNQVFDNTFGVNQYKDLDLFLMKQNLISFKDFLKTKNIDFYLVIAPNKNTIYQSKLPYQIKQNKTPLSQLISTINTEDELNVIDLRPILLSKKDSVQVYQKTDTHWNQLGAFYAYKEVIHKMSEKHKTIKPVSILNFTAETELIQGDITRMINNYTLEKSTKYNPSANSLVSAKKDTYKYKKFINPNKEFKLLMFRDSFATNWINFFNESFRETVYVRYDNISKTQIEKEKPDIVVLEIGERNLDIILKILKPSN